MQLVIKTLAKEEVASFHHTFKQYYSVRSPILHHSTLNPSSHLPVKLPHPPCAPGLPPPLGFIAITWPTLVWGQHIVECDGDTLLARYLGMYRLTVHEKETYMVVMSSIRPVGVQTHLLYDLKGSKVDRTASDKERAKDLPCLKVPLNGTQAWERERSRERERGREREREVEGERVSECA